MNTRFLLLATILLADLSLAALPPETLPNAIQQQAAGQEALARQESDAAGALRKWYESALDAIKKDATGRGDLNSVLAADQERDRLDRDLTPEEKAKLPPGMRKVRDQYDQARVQRANQQRAKLAASLRAYLTTLEGLEKRFTQDSDIQRALASRDERTKAEETLKALTPAAVPAAPAPAATTPQTSKEAAADPAANEPPTKGANLLTNGDFSKDLKGWTFESKFKKGTVAVDPAEKRNGKPTVRIDQTEADESLLWQAVAVKPGTHYLLTGWVKTKNVGAAGVKGGACFGLRRTFTRSEVVMKTQPWKKLTLDISTVGEKEIAVGSQLGHFLNFVTGTAWYSDLELKEVGPARAGPARK